MCKLDNIYDNNDTVCKLRDTFYYSADATLGRTNQCSTEEKQLKSSAM